MAVSTERRRTDGARQTTETKHAFKTTEFWVFLVVLIAILIAGDNIAGGRGHDVFGADKVWLYVTIITVGYLVSRGLAKAGAREPYSLLGESDGGLGGLGDRLAKAATVLREGELPDTSGAPSDGPRRAPLGR
jgi:predicted small secreted protein